MRHIESVTLKGGGLGSPEPVPVPVPLSLSGIVENGHPSIYSLSRLATKGMTRICSYTAANLTVPLEE